MGIQKIEGVSGLRCSVKTTKHCLRRKSAINRTVNEKCTLGTSGVHTGREFKARGVGLPHVVICFRGAYAVVARFIPWRTRTRGRSACRVWSFDPAELMWLWLALSRGAPGHGGGSSKTGESAFRVWSFVSAELVHGVARFIPWRTRGIKDRGVGLPCVVVWSRGAYVVVARFIPWRTRTRGGNSKTGESACRVWSFVSAELI